MPTPGESRAALSLVTGAAVEVAQRFLGSLTGLPDAQRAELFGAVPEIIGYYSEGSSALAADFYEDARDAAGVRGLFVAEPVILDRSRKVGNAIAWAAEPLQVGESTVASERLAEVVQLETAQPYRDTITTNRRRDSAAVGWQRISAGGCKFCRMLAGRGEVYRESSARFASHPHCQCAAQPVFEGQPGEEASVMQYVASKRRRTPAQRQALREHLAAMPD